MLLQSGEFAGNLTHSMDVVQGEVKRPRCSGYREASLSFFLRILGILTSASGVWSILLAEFPASFGSLVWGPGKRWLGSQCSPTNTYFHFYRQGTRSAFGKGS